VQAPRDIIFDLDCREQPMDLGRLNRNAKERNGVRAAIATVFIGLFMLVQSLLAALEALDGTAWIFGVPALIFFGLAVPVYGGSDDAALAVIGIFLLLMVLAALIGGLKILFPWPLIMAVVLWAGMRGVSVPSARPPVAPGR
jgi:apolipoprotein N-acyltransferase